MQCHGFADGLQLFFSTKGQRRKETKNEKKTRERRREARKEKRRLQLACRGLPKQGNPPRVDAAPASPRRASRLKRQTPRGKQKKEEAKKSETEEQTRRQKEKRKRKKEEKEHPYTPRALPHERQDRPTYVGWPVRQGGAN